MTDYTTTRDTRIQATLAAIDEATRPLCGYCGEPLPPDEPSDWWCSEACQRDWQARRAFLPPVIHPDHFGWLAADTELRPLTCRIVQHDMDGVLHIRLDHDYWGPDQRVLLCDWLRANGLTPGDIPIDSAITVEAGQITVDVYQRGENGGLVVGVGGNAARSTRTVPLAREWTPPADDGLQSAELAATVLDETHAAPDPLIPEHVWRRCLAPGRGIVTGLPEPGDVDADLRTLFRLFRRLTRRPE